MDLVTLSIPVYNVEKYVERALLSALNQTYENIEYLIVDDKGSDNSMNIVRDIISTYPRGKTAKIVEHPINLGLGAARNSAIEHAQGKYLFFMDSDDEITSDCIRKLYDEMEKTGVDVVCGSSCTVAENKIISSDTKSFIEKDKMQIMLSYFNNRFSIMVWNKLYKLSFLREKHINCVPYQTIEDNYFSFQILLNIQSYSRISDITYLFHVRNDSITGGGWNEKVFRQWTPIFSDLLESLQKSSLDSKLRIKVKKRLFKRRWGISAMALKSPHNVQHYINDYLTPNLLKDKDTFRSVFLFLAYIFSCMPFAIKKIGLLIHMRTVNHRTHGN
ncbi:MAG: glycosyltransferase family 2 protein [Prevotellaceae bacterium]|jgi:glycosyltransferase involved in cell wall biosynthesis|nr:glycosyltransferase family 2 protein [Prevotellaceae bacterium]